MKKEEAQERVERVRAFRRELETLAGEGVLELSPEQRERLTGHHEGLLRDLSERFEVDITAAERQLSWGMRIVSFLAALALGAGVFFLFYRFWGLLATPVQVTVLVAAPLLGLGAMALVSRWERTLYFTSLLGLLAFTCFVLNVKVLGTIFNITPSQNAFLVWAAFALLLSYAYGLRLLQVAGILSLLGWLSATIGTWSGCYWLSFGERPENFVAAGFVLFLIPLAIRHRAWPRFPAMYRLFGLLALFIAVLILANWGRASYLDLEPSAVEILYQCLGFLLSGLAIWGGTRLGWRETANLGVTFFVIFLYTKFFDWWWDYMPKYAFFLILGLVAVVLLFLLRWLRAWGRRVRG